MNKIMTLSEMTAGQIDKAVANFRALLEKHSKNYDQDAVQTVLGQKEFIDKVFTLFQDRVEAVSGMIVRKVKVDRSLSPVGLLRATGRVQYVNGIVVAEMPKGEGDEVEVVFFNLGCYVSDDILEKEYEIRGLKPADPYSQAAVNTVDPAFADKHPNGTHWKDENGNWCYSAFDRWGGEREVNVGQSDDDWDDDWWFAGLRK